MTAIAVSIVRLKAKTWILRIQLNTFADLTPAIETKIDDSEVDGFISRTYF